MAMQREDFLMREISRLRVMVASLVSRRTEAELDGALQLALDLQVRLFPLPAAEFLALDAVDQFNRLGQGFPEATAIERRLTYAELLFHTSALYDYRDREQLAAGARTLSLYIALLAASTHRDEASIRLVQIIRTVVSPDELPAPARALLDEFDAANG